jgi:hypothetical protein
MILASFYIKKKKRSAQYFTYLIQAKADYSPQLLIKILVVDIIPFRALISYCHKHQQRLLDPCKFCSGRYFLNMSFGCWLVKPFPLCVREADFSFF